MCSPIQFSPFISSIFISTLSFYLYQLNSPHTRLITLSLFAFLTNFIFIHFHILLTILLISIPSFTQLRCGRICDHNCDCNTHKDDAVVGTRSPQFPQTPTFSSPSLSLSLSLSLLIVFKIFLSCKCSSLRAPSSSSHNFLTPSHQFFTYHFFPTLFFFYSIFLSIFFLAQYSSFYFLLHSFLIFIFYDIVFHAITYFHFLSEIHTICFFYFVLTLFINFSLLNLLFSLSLFLFSVIKTPLYYSSSILFIFPVFFTSYFPHNYIPFKYRLLLCSLCKFLSFTQFHP
ncbi:unnamed protein product [Acanthosepion pharaonis]|uniref:Uncharacterized protein n=1 Tax=Acanthosepion pharaonis TaxID=158019 RepID=A0A812B2F2_ACAPH|nr:unnamed protein product [Sepia pharaonis]